MPRNLMETSSSMWMCSTIQAGAYSRKMKLKTMIWSLIMNQTAFKLMVTKKCLMRMLKKSVNRNAKRKGGTNPINFQAKAIPSMLPLRNSASTTLDTGALSTSKRIMWSPKTCISCWKMSELYRKTRSLIYYAKCSKYLRKMKTIWSWESKMCPKSKY